jgi:4-amino-4-deoxy-L-arabinose transferase-like glycosyltransferase
MKKLPLKIFSWSPAKILFALLLSALVFRLLLLNFRYAVGFDEVNYLKLGVSGHLHGMAETLHTYWAPLLPWLIALFSAFTSDYELAGRLVSLIAGTLLVLPVYFLGKLVYDKTAGFIAAAFIAFFPPLAFQSTLILTEATYTLFAALAVLAGWNMLKRYSITAALLSGLLAGCLYLTRPEGIGFLFIFFAWLIAGFAWKIFLIKPLRFVYLLLAMGSGFVIVSTPYLLFLKHATGSWTISAKGAANLQMDTPEDGSRPSFRSLNENNTSVPIDEVFHLGTFLKSGSAGNHTTVAEVSWRGLTSKYIRNFYDLIKTALPSFLTLLPLMFLGIGLLGSHWQWGQGWKNIFFLSFIGFYWFIVVPMFHINARYLAPMWPLCAIWIANGTGVFFGWLSTYESLLKLANAKKFNPAILSSALVVMLWLGFSFLPELGRILARNPNSTDRWADAVELKEAGLWLEKNADSEIVIMSRNHAVDYYAGNYNIRESITIPENGLDRVLSYARNRGANYLVVDERYRDEHPLLSFLLDNPQAPAGLELVYENKQASGLKTMIYKVL